VTVESKSVPVNLRLLYLVLGLVLGAAVVGSSWLITPSAKPPTVRKVEVNYTYETSPNTATGKQAMSVDSIQFHPGYIVITNERGFSRLLAVDRLREFSFQAATDQRPK
jgi:hypothetical protein